MNMPAQHGPELDALLGAYALDALDDDERARVDAYLAHNDSARAEVDELLESAASLALAPVDDVAAPPGLWDRISETIDGELDLDALDADDQLAVRRAVRSSRRVRGMALVAAAAIVVVAALATQVVSLHDQLKTRGTGEQEAAAAFSRAEHVSGARSAALAPANGAEVARVVLLPDGSGYLKTDKLATLDADHTYQLWAVTGSPSNPVVISAGVLGADPSAAAFRTVGDVHGFAITVERAPGVTQSSQAAFASATLS